jgi:hypothetical protein
MQVLLIGCIEEIKSRERGFASGFQFFKTQTLELLNFG